MATIPRCGDVVLHRPTGEKWVVAYADPETDTLSWAGWPVGLARLSDCESVERCSDDKHREWVSRWTSGKEPDHRRGVVARLYGSGE